MYKNLGFKLTNDKLYPHYAYPASPTKDKSRQDSQARFSILLQDLATETFEGFIKSCYRNDKILSERLLSAQTLRLFWSNSDHSGDHSFSAIVPPTADDDEQNEHK